MRDWIFLERYYEELLQDIYPQPIDDLHKKWMREIIIKVAHFFSGCKTVLDVGCGEGDAQDFFAAFSIQYTGICLGEQDVKAGQEKGRNISLQDFNFLPYLDYSYDVVFARHALEHSPFPLLTLMEFHRVARYGLCVIIPNPNHFTYLGRNHYSVMNPQQIRWTLRRAGWEIIWHQYTKYEYRFICQKRDRINYEGYVEIPVPNEVYEFDKRGTR